MSLKDQLIKLVGYLQTQIVGYPDFLTQEQLEASGKVDGWSAKDNLFHCLFWAGNQLEILKLLKKVKSGKTPEIMISSPSTRKCSWNTRTDPGRTAGRWRRRSTRG